MPVSLRAVSLGTLALFTVAGLVASAGCVGDDPTLSTADGGGGTGEAGSATDPCGRYCTTIMQSCTGPNRQYRDPTECAKFCALLAPGAEGDKSIDTVQCRLAQAVIAATKEACTIAGPYGGDVCGKRCEAFCTVDDRNCSSLGAGAPYTSRSSCIETCNGYRFDPSVGEGPDQPFEGQDTLNCRGFHLILSLSDKTVHCAHTAPASTQCFAHDAGRD